MGILSEDQIRNYHSILSIARARLEALYVGKKMLLYAGGNTTATQQYEILNFNIVPVELGGTKIIEATTIEEIVHKEDVTDLTIMLRYSDNAGHEELAELTSFLSANNITGL
jgi:hypothetical protein